MEELRGDCANCAGLCCVAPGFAASADFAAHKPAGVPCPNLQADFGCGIHQHLRVRGYAGCTVYDCFGAGQKLTQRTYAGQDWRRSPDPEPEMFAALPVMRALHELLLYLTEADRRRPAADISAELASMQALTELSGGALVALNVDAHRARANELLLRVSGSVRAGVRGERLERRGADLAGKDLRRTSLRGANLRGALLIGADLRDCDLTFADVIGADLRGADLCGADLREALYLTEPQVRAARGDASTRLPATVRRPQHWGS